MHEYDRMHGSLVCLMAVIILALSFTSLCRVAHAEDAKLKFGSDIRLRYEFQDDFNMKYYGDNPPQGSSNDDGFLLGRFRAGLDYFPSHMTHLALWMQDAEAWDLAIPDSAFYNSTLGDENNPYKDRWELWKAFIETKGLFNLPLGMKAGRQRIFFGDKRVFGPGEWGNTGRWIWDALKLSYRFDKGFLDMYYGRTMIHNPDQFSLKHRHFYESFGMYSHVDLPKSMYSIAVEPFFMTKRDNHRRYKGEDGLYGTLDSWYAGFRAYKKDIMGFDWDFTYVRQFGDYADDDIEAYGYHLLFGYRMKDISMSPRFSFEYSYASGDSNPYDHDHGRFDGAFGARDKMYGRMNLFRWQNIEDAQVNLELEPSEGSYVKAEFHKFWLAEDKDGWSLNPKAYRDKTGLAGDDVGKEFDIVARYDYTKATQIQVGFGHFWPGEFTKRLASGEQANWVFLQWEYKFTTGLI